VDLCCNADLPCLFFVFLALLPDESDIGAMRQCVNALLQGLLLHQVSQATEICPAFCQLIDILRHALASQYVVLKGFTEVGLGLDLANQLQTLAVRSRAQTIFVILAELLEMHAFHASDLASAY